jgi:bacterial/archaeal transporter family-2 protein
MINHVALAVLGGILVGVSRQVNGRLSLSTSPLVSSFWNHLVGFGLLTLIALALSGLVPPGASAAPWYAYAGGPIGVVFVAAGSWLIPRIGATSTAMLIVGGQMASGVVLDLLSNAPRPLIWSAVGIALIFSGMALLQRR